MDNIKVAIRVRPLIGRESGMDNHWVVQEDTIKPTEAVGKLATPYTFDRIFDELMTTYDLFEEVCKPIIAGAVLGFNGTIFAYGQSSSGKTFTMSGSAMQKGIITLSVEEIFDIIEASHHREFLIRVAYMEIYNEKVTDLLSTEEKVIKIQEDQEKNIQVTGVNEELVSNSGDVLAIIRKGDNRRHMAETKQNDRSSRSHCIIRIIIESREKGDEEAVMVAHLNFVDLAGSEKAGENSGDRLREGCSINKSLLILGQVISKLSDGVSNQHISYRDSKLTRILQISLGGNSKTAIIATITPASLEESHSTLRFASQAKKIKNKAMANEVLSEAAMLKKYQKEIHQQKQLNELGKIENQDLKKSLEQMEAQINNLKKFVIQSGPTQGQAKRKRRETWCPGKNKRMSIFRPSVSFAVEEDIFLSEMPAMDELPESLSNEGDKDSPMMPKNVTRRKRSFEQTKSQERRSAISMSPDAKTKQMMELEDKYEALLKEHARLQTEFNDMSTFHNLERETLEENIVELHSEKDRIHLDCMKLSDEVITTEHKLSIQTRRMTDCQSELESYRSSLPKDDGSQDGTNTDMLKLQQECDRLKQTIRQLEEEKASSKTDSLESTDAVQKLQEECSILKLQVEKLEAEKLELVEGSGTEHNKMATLEKEHALLQATAKDLADDRLTMNRELTDVELKIEQLPILKDKCEQLLQEKESLLMELNSLKEEGSTQPEIQEFENLKETASDLQQKLQQAEEDKMLLISKLEDLQCESKEKPVDNVMATMEEECKRLKEIVRELEEEKVHSKTEGADSNDVMLMQKLQEECSNLKLQIEKFETEKVKSVGGTDTDNNKMATLEEECEVLRATVKDLADERLNMQDELTEVGVKLEQLPILNEKCEELVQEKESLVLEISSLKQERNTGPEMQEVELQILREKSSKLQEQLEFSEEEKTQMISKMETLQSECQEKPIDNVMAKLEEECEVLRATVKDLADERLNMQDELTEVGLKVEQLPMLKEKCDKLEQEKESLLSEISSVKEEGKTELEIKELELQNLKDKAKCLEEKLEQAEEEKTRLISKVEEFQSEGQSKTADIPVSSLEEECERLRETIKQLEEEKMPSKTGADESNDAMQTLQEECSILKLQIEKLETEKIKSVEETDTENNKMATLEEECEILRATVKDLADERLNMQDELTEVGVKIEHLPILKEKCEELVQKNESLLGEISLLREGNSGSEMQVVELQILREKANNLQEQLELAKEEKDNLISRLENLQNEWEKTPIDNATAQLEEECEVLGATVKDLADERLNMQDEMTEVSVKLEQLPILKEKCEELVQEKESLLMEISSLKERNTGPEMQEVELQILREKASKLQEQLELVEEEKNNLLSRVETSGNNCQEKPMEEYERLRETIRQLEEEKVVSKTEESNDAIQKLQEECSNLKLQIQNLEVERVESVERTDAESKKIATLEGECEVLRATVKDLADECLNMQEKVTDIEQLPILKEKCEELVQEKTALLCEISSLKEGEETELGILELEELHDLREKAKSLEEKLEQAEKEKTRLISKVENLQSECQEKPVDNSMATLEEECKMLRETVRELEEEKELFKTEADDSNDAMQKLQEEFVILKLQIEKFETEKVKSVEGTDTDNNKTATLEEECEILRATVKDLADERLNMQDELTEVGVKIEQLPILKEKCEELVQEKESLLMEISSMKERNTGSEMQEVDLQVLREKASSLQEQLELAEEEKTQMISKMEILQSECQEKPIDNVMAKLEEECEVLRATVKDLADERLNMQDELTEFGVKIEQLPILKEKCEELVQEKESLLMEISSMKERNTGSEMQEVELQVLREKASSLQEQLELAEEEKTQMISKMEILQSECQEKPIDNVMAKLEEECEVLRATVKDLADERLNMQDELTEFGVKIEQLPILKEKCEELVQEKESLLMEISSMKERNTGSEMQEVELQVLREKASSLQEQLELAEKEKTQMISKMETLQSECQEKPIDNVMAKLEEECEVLRATVKDLADERLNMQDELTEVGLKIEQLPILQEKCDKFEQTNNSLIAEISLLKDTNVSLEVENKEKVNSLKQQLEEAIGEKVHLNSRLEVLEIDCQGKQVLGEECEVLRAKVEDLGNERLNMQDEITDLGLKAEQLPILKEKCEELVQEKDSLLQEISSLRQGTAEMERQSVEVRNLGEKVCSLQLRLEQSEQETLHLNSQLKVLEQERQEKTAVFQKCKSDYESIVLEKKVLDEKVQTLGSELAERISQQNAESGRVCVLLEEMSEMQETIARVEKERNEMEVQLEKTISELELKSCMDEELMQYQSEVDRLQEDKSQLSTELDILKQTLSDYDSPESMKSQIELLKLQIASLRSSAEMQKQELEDAICAKDKELGQLRAEISSLKDQLEVKPSQHSLSTLSSCVDMNTSAPWAEEKMELLKKIDALKIDRVKQARLMSEVNKMKEDKKMLISYCNDLEKQQQTAVDESDLGKKLAAAEADADKYYDLYNKQQTRIEELESTLRQTQTDMEGMKAQLHETEKKLTEIQQISAKQWEELGMKKMEILSQNRTIEEFEAKKQKLVQQYEETIEMKDNRIKKLQVDIRRRDADTSYMEPPSKAQKGDNSASKENMLGGAVDHYHVFMLEAKNLRQERELTRLKNRVKVLEDNPVTKPCSCPFQELSAKFEQQSEEKQRIQKEFDELKKKHIINISGREYDMSTINVPDVKVPTDDPREYSYHDDKPHSTSKRRTPSSYPKKPFSDNECKQQ